MNWTIGGVSAESRESSWHAEAIVRRTSAERPPAQSLPQQVPEPGGTLASARRLPDAGLA